MRLFIGVLLLLLVAIATSAEPVTWTFETDETGWRPRVDTITLERLEGTGATEDSAACLGIRGPIDTGWNYAISDTHPMQGGTLYRLSAWVRVDSVGEGTPMPFLKCEFLAADPAVQLGRANTSTYDEARMGEWQQLVGEFKAPEDTIKFWVALEKGTSAATEIEARLDDVRIEEIDVLSIFAQYALDPVPPELERARGVHPRIYIDAARVDALREAIKTTHAPLWEEVRALADRYVKSGPPAYREDDGFSGAEQLWQRGVGNAMPYMAMAYALTGEDTYLDGARAWAIASCSYKTWGLGRIDGMDLATGHQLLGLALVYDWCYDGLGEDARTTIRETLTRRAGAMFEAAATGQAWWRRSYMQNHLWVDVCGMSAAGFALFDEVENADRWIGLPREKFRKSMAALGDDGASHEGVGYWQYGAEYLLKFMFLARQLLGEDMFDHPWWRNTAAYWQYLSLPRGSWTSRNVLVDIADCPRGNWYGPDHILRALAAEYADPYAQWSALQVDEANVDAASARWLGLIWYDPRVKPRPPTDLPTLRHFADMGLVSARTGWQGDEALVVFKCGPHIGHQAIDAFTYDPGGGHVHPDVNHFLVFGCGEWLIRDDGYRSKWTGQHNTLLIDGKGQFGEGKQWFQGAEMLKAKAHPRVTTAVSTPLLDHIAGDGTEAYPSDLGLQRFQRHLLFLKPNTLLVLDDIDVDQSRDLELRFHPEQQELTQVDGAFIAQSERCKLRIEPLARDGATASAEALTGEDRHGGGDFSMMTVRVRKKAQSWRHATAITWAPTGQEPAVVTCRQGETRWTFELGDAAVLFNWDTGEAAPR